MKFKYKFFYIAMLAMCSLSCKKFLDVTPDNVGTIEYAFRNRNEAENYLATCYATLQQFNHHTSNAAFTTSGEIIYPNDTQAGFIDETGFNLIRGTQNTQNPGLNFWSGGNGGQLCYAAIRRCNTMLENIDKPVDLSATEKKRWIAEVKFLKAYYHYYLLRMYGPINIVDVNLPLNSSENARPKRVPVDKVVSYISNLLDEAAPDLPSVIENQVRELGRITRPIALSVKAELLAMAASPLFNGNPDYISFTNKDGEKLFPSSVDPEKWKKAADAAKAAIVECEAHGLKLYNFVAPANIARLNDSLKTVLTIQNAVTEKWEINPELVWALNPAFEYQGFVIPKLTAQAATTNSANPSNFSVPIATQELFYTQNGVPMNEDKTFDYSNRYEIRTGDPDNRYYIRSGYQTVKAHFNREARFYADIAFDGGVYFGNGNLNQEAPYFVQSRGNASIAGNKDRARANITGYWPKKLGNYQSVFDNGFQPVAFHLPLIRLAGLYLLYAEALNEYAGPNGEVYSYIDRVRARAGLQGVVLSWANFSKNAGKPGTKDGLREIIHRERRIELCFEAQSGWDLRRWKEMQGVLSEPLQGWNVDQADASNYYRPRTLITPVFGIKDYLWPIKTDDIVINGNLVQNPYW